MAGVDGTPRDVVVDAVRAACGHAPVRVRPLAGGGTNETVLADVADGTRVVVRVARHDTPWFTTESAVTALARDAGVPVPEILAVDHLDRDGEGLSVAVHRYVPGRTLDLALVDRPEGEVEALVADTGELLARIHSVVTDLGTPHVLRAPDEAEVARAEVAVARVVGPGAVRSLRRGLGLVADAAGTPPPMTCLAHGDFLPKNLVVDAGRVVAVIDWELAGPATPAHDLGRWEVSAGVPWHDRGDLLRRGYARVADPEVVADEVPAVAVAWALEKLGWRNPASPDQVRRCLDVVRRYTGG